MTLQETAAAFASALDERTRADGATFYCLKDGSPEWMAEAVRAAHGDMLPNDWSYQAVRGAVMALEEAARYGDADEIDDRREEIIDGLVDVYHGDLCAWVSSAASRGEFCTDAMGEYGQPESFLNLLQWGQSLEYQQVFGAVVEACKAQAEGVSHDN